MKKLPNKKTVLQLSVVTLIFIIVILAFLKKVHIGIYNAH